MRNSNLIKRLLVLAVILVVVAVISTDLAAQCPMCRIGPETNNARGGTEGNGLNKGIMLLLSLPYVLVGSLGFIWWRSKRK